MNDYRIPYLITPSAKVRPCCDQCGSEGVPVVVVGEAENYDTRTAAIWRACLTEAALPLPLYGESDA